MKEKNREKRKKWEKEGRSGKKREAVGKRGKQWEKEGSSGNKREAEGKRGKKREAEVKR